MNEFELKIIMDVLGIKRTGIVKDDVGRITDKYTFNGLSINKDLDGIRSVKISGKVPVEFSKIFYNKYPNAREASVGFYGTTKGELTDFYTIDKVKKFENSIWKKLGFSGEDKYTGGYSAYSKIGLLTFITEYQDYLAGKALNDPNISTHVDKQPELMAEINRRLISRGNPHITTEEFLRESDMIEVGTNEAALAIIEYLNAFDREVNPFSSGDEMKDPLDYSDKVDLKTYYDPKDDAVKVVISKDEMHFGYNRSLDKNQQYLGYMANYKENPQTEITINYHISAEENVNVVSIERYSIDGDYSTELVFDLISGVVREQSLDSLISNNILGRYSDFHVKPRVETRPITEEEKEYIIQKLQEATAVAKSVTSDMTIPRVPGVAKAYVPQPPVEQ